MSIQGGGVLVWLQPIKNPSGAGREGLFGDLFRRVLDEAFALGAFAGQLARTAHGFRLLAGFLLGRLLEISTRFHFAEQAFALHLLLQGAQGLFDIIVADGDLNNGQLSI